jgi:hypothetical protein
LDQQTEQPEWAAVRTGLFGKKLSFVPIQDAEPSGEQVRVPFEKDQVTTDEAQVSEEVRKEQIEADDR